MVSSNLRPRQMLTYFSHVVFDTISPASAMATVYQRMLHFMPGYSQIHEREQRQSIDGVTSCLTIDACRDVFEQIYHGDCLEGIASTDRKFLKDNALKVLEPLWVWQGKPVSASCKWWGLYLGLLIAILCASLAILKAYMFGLLSHFYYLTVLFMIWSHTVSSYATPLALQRLRRDFALTMEFPALGYALAAFIPRLYQMPWYSFIIIGLTTLHLIWNRFRPVISQDRLNWAYKAQQELAMDPVFKKFRPNLTAAQRRAITKWFKFLDVLEGPIDHMKKALEHPGSCRHNTQVAMFSEGWNNVIIGLYGLMPVYLCRVRLSRKAGNSEDQGGADRAVKLMLTALYFPVGILRAPPLYQAGEYGAFAQACIAIFDVGVTLCYRTRSKSYAIPAFSDHYSAVMIFAASGLLPIWLLWNQPNRFAKSTGLFSGFYSYMAVATFILGPALIQWLKTCIKRRYVSDQSKTDSLESEAQRPLELELSERYDFEAIATTTSLPVEYGRADGPAGVPFVGSVKKMG